MLKSLLITIVTASLLIGCATTVVTPVDLGPCPATPELPRMSQSQLAEFRELDPGIVQVLNKREDLLLAHIDTLCGIIESTGGA